MIIGLVSIALALPGSCLVFLFIQVKAMLEDIDKNEY